MGSSETDPVAATIAWFVAHEFTDVDRVAPGSSVLDATGLRARVWAGTPTSEEIEDTISATPDEAWCAGVFLKEPEPGLLRSDSGSRIAAFQLGPDGQLRALNPTAHDLVESVASRQRAKSFASHALNLLQQELGVSAPPDENPAQPADERGLPTRAPGKGVHEVPPSPQMAAQAAVEDPPPEPDATEVEEANQEQLRRIEEMRNQRALRKSVKHR